MDQLFSQFKSALRDGPIDTAEVEDLVSYLSTLHLTDIKGVHDAHIALCRSLYKSKAYGDFVIAQAKTILPHESDVDVAHIHLSTGIFLGIMLGLLAADRAQELAVAQ